MPRYFADAGGLFTGAGVEVSGYPVGKVTGIRLDGPQVLVTFTIAHNIHLGDRTEAAIRTKSLLGTKVLNVTPAGNGTLSGPIPLARTISPYQLPDALGELANTVSGLNTDQLSDSLSTLSQTFADTPPHLKTAVVGVARFAQTINNHDAQLRSLLTNAAKVTGVLAKRSDDVVHLVNDTNALLAEQFLAHFDGFSIGSNDLTQLTLGLDRDSGLELLAADFDERDPAVTALISQAIKACLAQGKYIGICGQGPSDHPDFAQWLMAQGISSISLNPDSVIDTWKSLAK